MKCEIKEIDGRLYANLSDLRFFFLETIHAVKNKKITLRVGLAAAMFLIDSIHRTAKEQELDEVRISSKRIKNLINKVIKTDKKKLKNTEQLLIDEELEELTEHEVHVAATGASKSLEALGIKTDILEALNILKNILKYTEPKEEIIENIEIEDQLNNGNVEDLNENIEASEDTEILEINPQNEDIVKEAVETPSTPKKRPGRPSKKREND